MGIYSVDLELLYSVLSLSVNPVPILNITLLGFLSNISSQSSEPNNPLYFPVPIVYPRTIASASSLILYFKRYLLLLVSYGLFGARNITPSAPFEVSSLYVFTNCDIFSILVWVVNFNGHSNIFSCDSHTILRSLTICSKNFILISNG